MGLIPRLAGPRLALKQEPLPPGLPVALLSLGDVSTEGRRGGAPGKGASTALGHHWESWLGTKHKAEVGRSPSPAARVESS